MKLTCSCGKTQDIPQHVLAKMNQISGPCVSCGEGDDGHGQVLFPRAWGHLRCYKKNVSRFFKAAAETPCCLSRNTLEGLSGMLLQRPPGNIVIPQGEFWIVDGKEITPYELTAEGGIGPIKKARKEGPLL